MGAAHGAGLAGADRSHAPQRLGGGLVMALQFAPQVLLPWKGYAADHFDQRKLLIFTQAAMGTLALLLGVLTVSLIPAPPDERAQSANRRIFRTFGGTCP
jgi:MFS family permease